MPQRVRVARNMVSEKCRPSIDRLSLLLFSIPASSPQRQGRATAHLRAPNTRPCITTRQMQPDLLFTRVTHSTCCVNTRVHVVSSAGTARSILTEAWHDALCLRSHLGRTRQTATKARFRFDTEWTACSMCFSTWRCESSAWCTASARCGVLTPEYAQTTGEGALPFLLCFCSRVHCMLHCLFVSPQGMAARSGTSDPVEGGAVLR